MIGQKGKKLLFFIVVYGLGKYRVLNTMLILNMSLVFFKKNVKDSAGDDVQKIAKNFFRYYDLKLLFKYKLISEKMFAKNVSQFAQIKK